MTTTRKPDTRVPDHETGSAYLITMMVLIVMTIVGLSLSLVTQTEMQLGATEKMIQETFYAADSGVAVGISRALTRNEQDPFTFVMNQENREKNFHLVNRINVSPFQAILNMPCNYCEINPNDSAFSNVNHAVTAFSERLGWVGSGTEVPDDAQVRARRSVSVMVELQPWRPAARAEMFQIPDERFRIRF
jgi:Tfp pilus assembly protein PilX